MVSGTLIFITQVRGIPFEVHGWLGGWDDDGSMRSKLKEEKQRRRAEAQKARKEVEEWRRKALAVEVKRQSAQEKEVFNCGPVEVVETRVGCLSLMHQPPAASSVVEPAKATRAIAVAPSRDLWWNERKKVSSVIVKVQRYDRCSFTAFCTLDCLPYIQRVMLIQ